MSQFATLILALCALAPASALIAGVTPLRMPASPPTTLRNIRADAPPPPQKGRLGATVDQDGKSNVWVRGAPLALRAACRRCIALPRATLALSPNFPHRHVLTRPSRAQAVEPSVKVDREEKGIMQYAPVAGVAALALLLIPFLPALFAANPDQG